MNQSEPLTKENKLFHFIWPVFVIVVFFSIILGLYQFSQSIIRIEAPEQDLGKKVIISLPEGNIVYTYEKYLVEEDGKLFYKGERNTINLTGGDVVYENWE